MKKYKYLLIALNLALLLICFNYSVFRKEKILSKGELILLELAPVDPRSLFQGDYMQLDYAISRSGDPKIMPANGFYIVTKDLNNVAKMVRVQETPVPLANHEFALRYKTREFGFRKIGSDSYFFQEGKAEKFDSARYGGLKIDKSGAGILVGLYDKKFQLIH